MGSNLIEVAFQSPAKYANQLNSTYPYNIPTYVYSQYVKTVRNFVRKAQSGKPILQLGLWGPPHDLCPLTFDLAPPLSNVMS